MKKAYYLLTIMLVIGFVVGGCRPNKEVTINKDSPQIIRVAAWGTVEEKQQLSSLLNVYMAENPDFLVSLEMSPRLKDKEDDTDSRIDGYLPGYEQRILILIEAKDAPDVLLVPEERFGYYANRNAFLALNQFGFDEEKKHPSLSVNGVLYGIPHRKPGIAWAVYAGTKHPQEAVKLMVYLAKNAGLN